MNEKVECNHYMFIIKLSNVSHFFPIKIKEGKLENVMKDHSYTQWVTCHISILFLLLTTTRYSHSKYLYQTATMFPHTASILRLKPIFFSESQTMLSLTKFLLKIINMLNTKLILLDR
jgi:hypothetical protein